jgi:hypothetical protein
MSAVTNGAKARITAMSIRDGNREVAPNSDKAGPNCFVNTKPNNKSSERDKGQRSNTNLVTLSPNLLKLK